VAVAQKKKRRTFKKKQNEDWMSDISLAVDPALFFYF
jgi:hypothetical protein